MRRGCFLSLAVAVVALIAAIGWLAWQGSDASLPPLAKGLDGTFTVGQRQLDQRVKALYPVGSSEQRLLADLRKQGFDVTVDPAGLSTANVRRFIGCGDKLISIRWQAKAEIITEIFGVYGAICL